MNSTKSTKRTLLTSVMALLLCFSMLLGTTFAWFTDSVSSDNNVIKSGKLDVELYWADGAESIPTDVADWTNAASGPLYTADQIWEPGYTDAKHLMIANEGTLALKYQLAIVPNGEVSALADVIDVYYIEGGLEIADRADLAGLEPIGTLSDLINTGIQRGSLTAGENLVVTIVLKMQEEAGNEYQNLAIGSDFAINLIATQYTYEEDSFDNSYDGATEWYGDFDYTWYDATATELEIGSAEQLAALATIVNGTAVSASTYSARATTLQDSLAGKVITLTSDIDLAGIAWTAIGNWDNAFSGTFDGNGYTINNLYINSPEGEGVGLFGVAENANIKNLTINNVDVTGYSMVAAVVGSPYTGCLISNCHVTGEIDITAEYAYAGGISAYGYVNIENCSVIADDIGSITAVNRNAVGGISAWLLEGDFHVTGCDVANLELTGWANIGSITGFVHYSNVIDGCTAENITITKTRVDGHPTVGYIAGGFSYNANKPSTLTNNSVNGIVVNGTAVAVDSANILYGAEYGGALNSNFILANNSVQNVENNLVYSKEIKTVADLENAFANSGIYVLKNDLALTAPVTVVNGVDTTIYMNGKTISATSTETGKNFEVINVYGTLTVNGGNFTTEHKGTNMGWNNSTNVFNVVSGGTLNLNDATVVNLGGSDMAYAVNIGNNGGATLNVSNSVLESKNYTALRVFNNADGAINVNLDNGTKLVSSSAPFFVHFWSAADLGDKQAQRQAYLTVNFNDTEISRYSGSISLVRFGFTDAIYFTSTELDTLAVASEAALQYALDNGYNATLVNDITMAASRSNAYGATGVIVNNQILDGNGYTLKVTGAGGTWDSAIFIKSGTVKNITVASAFRGIFTSDAANGDIYLDNVSFKNVVYTFNSDGSSNTREGGVYITNCAMNGWTSFSNTHTEVVFENCSFGEGSGYKTCRPYNATQFINCEFAAGYTIDQSQTNDIVFVDCIFN